MFTCLLRNRFIALLVVQVLFLRVATAQDNNKCGFDKTIKAVRFLNPAFGNTLDSVRSGERNKQNSAAKATNRPIVIPVVFHIVLTQAQLNTIGDSNGVKQRIDSQMAVINRDFNALNADSASIPGGFKSLFANVDVNFALAHTAPDGSATPGYEIIIAPKTGFDLERETGSGFGFSGVKYRRSGGADAWDVASYLNIWVLNPLEQGRTTNILGLAIPPYLTNETTGIDPVERGIVLHYRAFGKRSSITEQYIPGSDMGRTLTHEIGHFFELFHIWGDDEGKCPGTGGTDDAVADTPPQAYPSSGCFTFPKFDACSKVDNGIMFMNYMDYSNDKCLLLFTHGQASRMKASLQAGGDAYSLTQHPGLLQYPAGALADNDFVVYPNPADDRLNITFKKQPKGLRGIYITDIAGRVIIAQTYKWQVGFYTFPVAGLYAGLYFVALDFESGKEVRKVFIR